MTPSAGHNENYENMKEEKYLEQRFGRDPGFRVPDGYFDEVFAKVAAALPDPVEAPPAPRLTTWQKLRPYVYLAAMFAGIWCMMKIFHTAATSSSTLSLDSPPEAVAVVMADPEAANVYMTETYESDFELESELLQQYDNIADLQKDFNYEFKPEYADIRIHT